MLARPVVAVAATEEARGRVASAWDLVRLRALVDRTTGDPGVRVALLDGPVAAHPHLAEAQVRWISGSSACAALTSPACAHGTFVAGILVADRASEAPGICSGCTLLVRPIFGEPGPAQASPVEVARALVESVAAGARVVNLSVEASGPAQRALDEALRFAARRGVLVVAAAGNTATLGRSAVASHPAVLPVMAVDRHGVPLPDASLGPSIGRRGLAAPGELTSLAAPGGVRRGAGSSAAAAVVSGAAALLWSSFPDASATEVRRALVGRTPRTAVVPPLMDAEAAYQALTGLTRRRCR